METAANYLQMLKDIKSVTFATVDEKGRPQVRVINVMIVEDDKLYFTTASGKAFYKQLTDRKEVSVLGMTEDLKGIRLYGKVKKMDREWTDRVFKENPGMGRLYSGDKRYILDVFCIDSGFGECFDLGAKPVERISFSFGGMQIEFTGFFIGDTCTSCGICRDICPVGCVKEGIPYKIIQKHCIRCGLCAEACPVGSII